MDSYVEYEEYALIYAWFAEIVRTNGNGKRNRQDRRDRHADAAASNGVRRRSNDSNERNGSMDDSIATNCGTVEVPDVAITTIGASVPMERETDVVENAAAKTLSTARWDIPTAILLTGPTGTGKSSFLYSLADEFRATVVHPTVANLLHSFPQSIEKYVCMARQSSPAICILDHFETLVLQSPVEVYSVLSNILNTLTPNDPVLVVAITTSPHLLHSQFQDLFPLKFDIKLPNEIQRVRILEHYSKSYGLHVNNIDKLDLSEFWKSFSAKCVGMNVADLKAIMKRIQRTAIQHHQPDQQQDLHVSAADFMTALHEYRLANSHKWRSLTLNNPTSSYTLQDNPMQPTISTRDVGYSSLSQTLEATFFGLKKLQQNISDVIRYSLRDPTAAADDILLNYLEPVRGMLLIGPPVGTGKTKLARNLAKSTTVRLVSISISDIVRGEIGESEKRLWQVFEVAKTSQPCILFIDEFQALFSSRTDEHSGSSSLITAMFSIFDDLARNPTCRIIILGATNIPSLIDPAFLRMGRFSHQYFVSLPDFDARKDFFTTILSYTSQEKDRNFGPDFTSLCHETEGFSIADLLSVYRAAVMALQDAGRPIEIQELSAASKSIRRSVNDDTMIMLRTWVDQRKFKHRGS